MNTLYIVGIGPGDHEFMTFEADSALKNCDVICGYNLYVDLVSNLYPDKEFIKTGMTKEIDRCKLALDTVNNGKNVSMVCSGDACIYGMTGLIYQLYSNGSYNDIDIVVVAGVSACISGGAVLGSPLTNDFAVVSLSDLLTPPDVIAKRLEGVGIGDFVCVIYNPASKKRVDNLFNACQILLKYKPNNTVCGYVKNIGREGQTYEVLTLAELANAKLDMFTTVFIGNSQTTIIDGKMVTSRGYEKKLEFVEG